MDRTVRIRQCRCDGGLLLNFLSYYIVCIFVVFNFVMCKDNDFSPQITRINTDYFIEKWSQNETGTFRNKKQVKRKCFTLI